MLPDEESSSHEFSCVIGECDASQVAYAWLIDIFSSITFDWQHPNYSYVSFPSSAQKYELNGEETYEITSQFNELKFPYSAWAENINEDLLSWMEEDGEYADEDILERISTAINIYVSYKYCISTSCSEDAHATFIFAKMEL